LSPADDLDGFSASLYRVVEDRALRERLSSGGWAHVRQRYHFTRLVDDTAALYRQLLA